MDQGRKVRRHRKSLVAEGGQLVGLHAAAAAVEGDDQGEAHGDFGRGDEAYDRAFSESKSPMVPITESPFHAAAFGLSDLGTKGGLRTDSRARVLDRSGDVIPGLYAAGTSFQGRLDVDYSDCPTECTTASGPRAWKSPGSCAP